jgi:hypothetical protein
VGAERPHRGWRGGGEDLGAPGTTTHALNSACLSLCVCLPVSLPVCLPACLHVRSQLEWGLSRPTVAGDAAHACRPRTKSLSVCPSARLPSACVHMQLEWELSGPTVAGEGEVKILGRLARPRHADSVDPSDTHSE